MNTLIFPHVTRAQVMDAFNYNPTTGLFTRTYNIRTGRGAGGEQLPLAKIGPPKTTFEGKFLYHAVMAILITHDKLIHITKIDWKNGDKKDSRIDNLIFDPNDAYPQVAPPVVKPVIPTAPINPDKVITLKPWQVVKMMKEHHRYNRTAFPKAIRPYLEPPVYFDSVLNHPEYPKALEVLGTIIQIIPEPPSYEEQQKELKILRELCSYDIK